MATSPVVHGQSPAPRLAVALKAFIAPTIRWPLPNLDPWIASRGDRPSLAELSRYLDGGGGLLSVDPFAGSNDWRLSYPSMGAVSGYADAVSVLPGGTIGLHLAGADRSARIDFFRIGARDAQHMLRVDAAPIAPLVVPAPDPATGLDEMGWPVSYRLAVAKSWRTGIYLAKLTAAHGQSYVLFIVRPPKPDRLEVMVPMVTFEAYNEWDRVSLYTWYPHRRTPPVRGYRVSFDRPFRSENGAALFFRTAFPLIVWLEDHGYRPGYVADADIAAQPAYATGARTIVMAGHTEYWTRSMRDALVAAESRGVGVVGFGANLVYRQIRLEPSSRSVANRTVVCYKAAALDPFALREPQLTTVEFANLPRPEPMHQVLGADYVGMATRPVPLILAPAIATFAPGIGLKAGQVIPTLLAGELDQLTDTSRGVALSETPVITAEGRLVQATASLWLSPGGAHVFDAGTFAWTWGLDPRYAAALPGFPADSFAHLTAAILAWAGAFPSGG